MINKKHILLLSFVLLISFISCAYDLSTAVITKPDEYTHVYEAKDTPILRAIAAVFKEKDMGTNVTIDYKNLRVESDYVVSGDWRTKANAKLKKLNWRECEVTLIIATEKKTKSGWETRRLLEKDKYETLFSVIDLKIYEEMSKIE